MVLTGRALYLKFCQARGKRPLSGYNTDEQQLPARPLCWEALHHRDRDVWTDLARRLTTGARR